MKAEGFAPVYDEESRLLILGSFPSVKSRAEGFYYGNPQNRFWRAVCGFFGEETPRSIEEKRRFLFRRRIALWDVVTACEIEGSMDASIKEETVADVASLVRSSRIERIFCNGTKAFETLQKNFPDLMPIAEKLPSTSPANPRFSEKVWREALKSVFGER